MTRDAGRSEAETPTDHEIDRAWVKEAEDRWAAYERGEIPTVELTDVLAKHNLK